MPLTAGLQQQRETAQKARILTWYRAQITAQNRPSAPAIGPERPARAAHNRQYALRIAPVDERFVIRLTGWLTLKLEGYEK